MTRISTHELRQAIRTFSMKELSVFVFCFAAFLMSFFYVTSALYKKTLVQVPAYGGTYTEGILLAPRAINPVLSFSNSEKDLTALIYSGLLRKSPKGELLPDLAESYTISPDGKTYTFTLKPKLTFHDGTPITAHDVVFTIQTIKNSAIKSPKKVQWEGVTATEIDSKTVEFTLKQKYATFLENTTIGILPAHIWETFSPEQFALTEYNTKPIGSGPYKVETVTRTKEGIAESYTLRSFKNFALGKPYIKTFVLRFFADEATLKQAFEKKEIDGMSGLSPKQIKNLHKDSKTTINNYVLPRVFGLFINQQAAGVLADNAVVSAINEILPRQKIVDTVLFGYAQSITTPIPLLNVSESKTAGDREKATALLAKAGWERNDSGIWQKKDKKGVTELSFSLTTTDIPELAQAAQIIKEELESFGIRVEVIVYGIGQFNQIAIQPRKYQAVFFGQMINHDTDIFAFWHSTQRASPGLNISLYTNPKVDSLLEAAQTTLDKNARKELYESIASHLLKDSPALLVYSPDLTYVTRALFGNTVETISDESERFQNVYEWYRQKDSVWKLFANFRQPNF